MTIKDIRDQMELATAGRLVDYNPTAQSLLISLDFIGRIVARGNHHSPACHCTGCALRRDAIKVMDQILEAFEKATSQHCDAMEDEKPELLAKGYKCE